MLGTHSTWDAGYSADHICLCDIEQEEWNDAWQRLWVLAQCLELVLVRLQEIVWLIQEADDKQKHRPEKTERLPAWDNELVLP